MACTNVNVNSRSVGTKTQPESKCPELLANYCDMLLRKTPLSKKLTSEEVEKKLRDVVSTNSSVYIDLFRPFSPDGLFSTPNLELGIQVLNCA